MDASTVGDISVTVAVRAAREQEPAILDSIYECGADIPFKPFYDKANDYKYPVRREFTEALLQRTPGRIATFAHRHSVDGNRDTEQVEAVHSAIHVHDLLQDGSAEPIVIVDGNEQQATPFVKALSGLRDDQPPVAHCQQSELYYPTALLADLASNYLAHRVEELGRSTPVEDLPVSVPRAQTTRSNDWGVAINASYTTAIDYVPVSLPALRGDSVRERINCWCQGAVATDAGADRPMSDSLRQVIGTLRQQGYDELADTFEEL